MLVYETGWILYLIHCYEPKTSNQVAHYGKHPFLSTGQYELHIYTYLRSHYGSYIIHLNTHGWFHLFQEIKLSLTCFPT